MCTVKELKMLLEGIDDDTVVNVIVEYADDETVYLPVDKFCHVPIDNAQGLITENNIYFHTNSVY